MIFSGTNEVRAGYNTPTAEYIDVQESYNHTFIDTMRAKGSSNAYRNLIVQTYNSYI
ncbi:hypothetical protein R9C00_07930 [Flammeovirgaceae bacterium SG7u.111]|nr:hypothetical protein [Flammeovirgaceae bacterium SG7u.132]WPO37375.1 hypothetical protein R9C00_07930 [Flammeovirgaceae bacterium SG7u.111]